MHIPSFVQAVDFQYLFCCFGGRAKKLKTGAACHVLLDAECKTWANGEAQVPSSASWEATWDPAKPHIITSVGDCFKDGEIEKALMSFSALFRDSSIRVTEGRAQAPVKQEAAHAFAAGVQQLASRDAVMELQPEDVQQFPEVGKVMDCVSFGIAASHVSVAKFELHMMPCCRVQFTGTRYVTVVLLRPVLNHLKKTVEGEVTLQRVQDFIFKCSASELEELNKDGGAFCATVGPNDLLYLPAGCMVSHRVMGQDISGLRIGILAKGMLADLEALQPLVAKSGFVNEALKYIGSLRGAPEDKNDEDAQKAEEAAKREEEARKAVEAQKKEEARQAEEEARQAEEARKAEETRKAEEEARKQEETRKAKEEARKQEEARKAEEARKQEEARKAEEEEARKQEEARKAEEEARKQEEARKAEETRKAEEEARKQEEARKKEEARKAEEEARKQKEARKAADKRKAEEEARKAGKAEEPLHHF